jgi:putative FmdB family regulatory protein
MPVFDYKCKDCSTNYDILHKGREIIEDIECPVCGSHKYLKLISLPSILTKESSPCGQGACGMRRPHCDETCEMN